MASKSWQSISHSRYKQYRDDLKHMELTNNGWNMHYEQKKKKKKKPETKKNQKKNGEKQLLTWSERGLF